jgi:hypothetical protein
LRIQIKTRNFKSVDYSDPEADIVTIAFESSITKLATAFETVSPELGKTEDGTLPVIRLNENGRVRSWFQP